MPLPTTVHLYQLTLRLDTPGGVAAPERRRADAAGTVSLPLARDADDRPLVPASSLAGSLRAHAEGTTTGAGRRLFGHAQDGDDEFATLSPVRVLGTRTTLPADAPAPSYRASTAVDLRRGAAASATLRERELLPPGTTITAWLRIDPSDAAGELERLLPTWSPYIGGGRSTGHGRARLTRVTRRVLDISTGEGRRAWLTQSGPGLFQDAAVLLTADEPQSEPHGVGDPAASVFETPLRFDIVDALHVGSGKRKEGGQRATDRALLLRDHLGRPVVPGTTWKGVLRARCAFILRSLAQSAACASSPSCGACRICTAFGHADGGGESGGTRGRLVFLQSPVLRPDGAPAPTVARHHVGLDRFTGGAAAGLLFTDEIVENGRVEVTILDEPCDPQSEPLDPVMRDVLLLALHDLHTGMLGVGGSTTRGYGTLRGTADTAAYLEREAASARERLGRALPALRRAENPEVREA